MNLNTAGWASRILTPLLRIIRSSPNATVPVVVLSEPVNSETAVLVDADIALVAKGTGATLAQVPDGTAAGGDKRGVRAVDWQKNRASASRVASGRESTIGGGQSNEASTDGTFVGGGFNNTASGLYSTIAGGESSVATNTCAFVGGGKANDASGNTSTVCGGANNSANGQFSFIGGGQRGTARSITGNQVFPACDSPIASAIGATQSALLLLGRQTTTATATVLTSDSGAGSTTNQVILPNNSAYSFSGEVIAGVTGASSSARWTINGAIKRGANAASTVMVGTPTVIMTHNDAGAVTWVVAVTADATNGGIKVTVTGAAATTIRWVCQINTTEMTY